MSPVALVTGAAGGIGGAVTARLAASGLTVAAVDRKPVESDGNVHGYRADVTDAVEVGALIERIEDELGAIEVLVNAAGLLRTGSVLDTDPAVFGELLLVNAIAIDLLSREVATVMVPRRRGAIVTVSSNAGGVPRSGMAAYGASKAAASSYTKALGLELAEHGIRCNVVAPGTTRTGMLDDLGESDAVIRAAVDGDASAYKVGIPLGRVAEPCDIAAAVAFLVSDDARHITMQELYVDGGATLR